MTRDAGFEGWDPQDEGRREALCTLGNGRFATRGAAPESVADGVHYPGTYAAGCFNRLRDELDGQVVENESMVNLPNWLDLRFAVDDGDHEDPAWVDLSQVQVLQHKVELDLRRGLLNRKLRFTDGAGRTTSVRQRRFVYMGQSQLAGLHSVFTAENWSGRLLVASGIDGTVTNAGVSRYAGMAARHLDVVALREIDPLTVLLVARTSQSDLCIAEAARTTVRIYVPIGPDGVISQFEGYRDLAEIDWAEYRRRYGDIQRLDRILEAEGRSVDDYQVAKQADVLMLFYLLSADELRELLGRLGYALPAEAIPRTIEYYLARTSHGSTLSALVGAWVLARAHREQALRQFELALRSDVADIRGGTMAEGVHLGAMAGCVDLLQRCFAGLETRQGPSGSTPHCRTISGDEFAVQYRGQSLSVRVSGRQVRVGAEAGPGRVVRVGCGDEVSELPPGETVVFAATGTGERAAGTGER